MNGLLNVTLLAQQAAPSLSEPGGLLSGLNGDERASIVMAIVVGVVATVITLGCVGWNIANSMHRRKLEAELKRDMLDRGMSADEVVKVIEAASPPEGGVDRWISSWGKTKA